MYVLQAVALDIDRTQSNIIDCCLAVSKFDVLYRMVLHYASARVGTLSDLIVLFIAINGVVVFDRDLDIANRAFFALEQLTEVHR